MPSPNRYTGNQGQRLLVIHATEGITHWRDLGNFFADPNRQASSHTGIDNYDPGVIGEYVKRKDSAWTGSGANQVAIQTELCAPSGASDNWTRDKWMSQIVMLENCARWLKEESDATGIPLTILTPAQAQGNGRGVCQHADLGAWGGGHHDCGQAFPIDYVVGLARGTQPDTAPTTREDDDVFYLAFDDDGSAALAFTNKQADGKHRVRLFASRTCRVQLDLRAAEQTFNLGYESGPQGMKIPSDVKCGVVRMLESPTSHAAIACTISESS
jgi:hypothetical protein